MEIQTALWFDDRGYRIKLKDGYVFECASVTTKLGIEDKPFLLKYYANLGWDNARRELHESQDRGKRIHFALYCYLMNGVVIYNPWQQPLYTEEQVEELKKSNPYFMVLKNQEEMLAMWKLQRFFEVVKPTILEAEKTVWSIEHGIAGTLDMVLMIEKGTYDVNGSKKLVIPETGAYIGDLKTGNQINDSAWNQISAYQMAYEGLSGLKTKGGLVLHTNSANRSGIEGFAAILRTKEEFKDDFQIFKSLAYVWDKRNPNFTLKAFNFPTIIKRGES